jgi:hypothetical protein
LESDGHPRCQGATTMPSPVRTVIPAEITDLVASLEG